MNLKFLRESRTLSSETYAVISNDEYVGNLSLHFCEFIKGILFIESDFYDKEDIGFNELSLIHNQIKDEILPIGMAEGFGLSIVRGDQVFYSLKKPTDSSEEPVTKGDLQKLKGKVKDLSGKLTEYVVADYFRFLGFESSRAGPELDHKKIDVVAHKDKVSIYAQVKDGQIGDREIENIVCTISNFESPPTYIAIIARSFSSNSEFRRIGLEEQYNTRILLITKDDIMSCLPEHKRHEKFISQL